MGKITQDPAKAMVEGNGNAEPILFGKFHTLPDNETVVEDIVVGQDNSLGEPGDPARVLDIDRMIKREPFAPSRMSSIVICLFQKSPHVYMPLCGISPMKIAFLRNGNFSEEILPVRPPNILMHGDAGFGLRVFCRDPVDHLTDGHSQQGDHRCPALNRW